MFFFIVANKIFFLFKKMSVCFFGRGYISREGVKFSSSQCFLCFFFFFFGGEVVGGVGLGKKEWGQYFRVGLIPWRTLQWIFEKWFIKMLKKTFMSIYIQVLKFYEVLSCTYFKGLSLFCLCSAFKGLFCLV